MRILLSVQRVHPPFYVPKQVLATGHVGGSDGEVVWAVCPAEELHTKLGGSAGSVCAATLHKELARRSSFRARPSQQL